MNLADISEIDSPVESYLCLARRAARWAKRRLPAWIEFDDILQCARLGLVEAARRFDPDRGTPFFVYARKHVYGAAIDAFRSVRYRDYQHVQLLEAVPLEWPDSDQRLACRDLRQILSRILRDLPKREQDLLVRRYWHGTAMRDIANILRISTSQAHKLHTHALGKIRSEFYRTMHFAVRGPGVVIRLLLP